MTPRAVSRPEGRDRRRAGPRLWHHGRQLRPWHYHNPFFQSARSLRRPPQQPLRQAGHSQALPRVLCRHRVAHRRRARAQRSLRAEGRKTRTLSAPISTARATSACSPISCPTANGWAPCCASYASGLFRRKHPRELPYVLRGEAHTLSTEAVAMMFEKFADDPALAPSDGHHGAPARAVPPGDVAAPPGEAVGLLPLVPGDVPFRASLYENPDQDLNRLWWDLVKALSGVAAAGRARCPGLRREDPHRHVAGLLSQLHAGRAFRGPNCATR